MMDWTDNKISCDRSTGYEVLKSSSPLRCLSFAISGALMSSGTARHRARAASAPDRATRQGLSEVNKTRFHLPDGAAQQARDAEMARGTTDFSPKAVAWLYGYDTGRPEGSPID
jgi:hypothetical protein